VGGVIELFLAGLGDYEVRAYDGGEGVGVIDGGEDLLLPLGGEGDVLPVDPGVSVVILEGILEPTYELLVLSGVGDENVCHGHLSPGRFNLSAPRRSVRKRQQRPKDRWGSRSFSSHKRTMSSQPSAVYKAHALLSAHI
jgi:hypothetical protein